MRIRWTLIQRGMCTKIVLELFYPFGLEEFSATTALYLIDPFWLKQHKSFLYLCFNLRIILLQASFKRTLACSKLFSLKTLRKTLFSSKSKGNKQTKFKG